MASSQLLITGIPRSGTSYLCAILNKVKNTVIVNEPAEVFEIQKRGSPVGLSSYYEFVRSQIGKNIPIHNKMVNGKFIEDTSQIDIRTSYIPDVDPQNFLLGTKNTLVYLNTLERLLTEFGEATIVACVRHPYDTIASWSKVSFPHLNRADPSFLLNYADDARQQELRTIIQISDQAIRYAVYWNYLANIIIQNETELLVVNYEAMIENPQDTLIQIFEASSFPFQLKEKIEKSTPRHHQLLDDRIKEAIDKNCRDTAMHMGYLI